MCVGGLVCAAHAVTGCNCPCQGPDQAVPSARAPSCQQARKDPRVENLDFLEKGKEVGRMWGEADEATKQVYAKMALQDKSRYTDEMGRYVPSAAYLQKVNAPPRLEKDPDAPAKARTPYRTRAPGLAPTLGNGNH